MGFVYQHLHVKFKGLICFVCFFLGVRKRKNTTSVAYKMQKGSERRKNAEEQEGSKGI